MKKNLNKAYILIPPAWLNQRTSIVCVKQYGACCDTLQHGDEALRTLQFKSDSSKTKSTQSTMCDGEHSGPGTWNNLKISCHSTEIPCANCTVWLLKFLHF
jgi:hypothetical protein